MNEPITRSEMYLAALGGEAVTLPDPLTREELYLAYLNGMTDTYPEPITRTDQYLYKLCQNGMGSGGGVTIRNQNKTITENGSYKADSGYTGLGTVTVNVPQEDPILQDKTVTENGTVTADPGFDGLGVVTVNVAASGVGDEYTAVADIMQQTVTRIYNPVATKLMQEAMFKGNTKLTEVDLPNVTQLGAYLFQSCTALKSVNLPKAKNFGTQMFSNCKSLTEVHLPSMASSISQFACLNCSSLKVFDCGGVHAGYDSGYEQKAFEGCTSLVVFAYRTTNYIPILNSGFFHTTTPISQGTGLILVPAELIDGFKIDTNWCVFENQMRTVQDFTVDGSLEGDLDWDKINAEIALLTGGANE